SFSNNDTTSGLVAGSYYLEVTDANGCDTFSLVNVIEPQVALQGSPQIFGIQCKGDSTGMLVGDAGGGWGPYSYYWLDSQGDTLQSSIGITTRDTLFNLATGSYILHVYDSRDCFIDYVLNVPEPAIALSIDSLNVIESIACYGDSVGKAIMYVSGGMPNAQPNYYYLWDNGETTLVAEALTSGYHSVILRDDWGCEVLDSIEIPENPLIESDLVVNTTVSCYGESDGIAVISTQGGASFTYTYFWSQGQNTVGVNLDTAVGLLHGSYYVTTRDILGCEVVDSVYISEPEPLSMEASELDWVDCYNEATGEAFATATGGTESYLFSWDNGTWIGDTINTLTPGIHTVLVTDSRGCTSSDTVETHNPDSLYINIDDTQTELPYCVGVNTASLSAVAFGGTPGYTYEWDDNSILPQTTTTATALLAGIYTITVTDSKGCIASDTRDIDTVTNTMYTSITSLYQYASGSLDSNEISCFGYNDGGAYAQSEGGDYPYTYQWYGPNGFNGNDSVIYNLYAGTYSVTVQDVNNCMVNSSIILIEPSALTFNTSININESCLGACDGAILVDSIAGGVSPFSADLTDNITSVVSSHLMSVTSIGSLDTILDVCSGDYTVTLTDVNDCPSLVISGGVNQQLVDYNVQTEAIINVLTAEDTICHNSSTGSLEVLNPNMNSGYTYSWSNGESGLSIDGLSLGIYILYADYNNTSGCTTTDTLEIIELPEITNMATQVDVDCYGENTGSANANPSGGVLPYDYFWDTSPIQTGATATNLEAGSYIVKVIDANDCYNEFYYTIGQVPEIVIDIDIYNTYIHTSSVLSGGIAPYTYEWFSSPSTQVLSSSNTYTVPSNGIYYVEVTDANGCVQTSEMIYFGTTGVIESDLLSLDIYPNPFNTETTVDFGRTIKQGI
ncbi:hypothetical protein OAK24_02620, partial [Flavobacteriales bacterium]|nr:hypothetical protein [Flavobacteriales bacterium]